MAYTLSKAERETIISFNEEDAEAVVYTASPIWMRKMDKLVEINPAAFKELEAERQYHDGQVISKRYTMPKKLVSIRSKQQTYSEEQRARMTERLNAFRMNSVSKTPHAAGEKTD